MSVFCRSYSLNFWIVRAIARNCNRDVQVADSHYDEFQVRQSRKHDCPMPGVKHHQDTQYTSDEGYHHDEPPAPDTQLLKKRKLFIDTLFQLLKKTEYKSFHELSESWQNGTTSMHSSIKSSDPEVKKFIIKTMNELAKLSVKNLIKQIKQQ